MKRKKKKNIDMTMSIGGITFISRRDVRRLYLNHNKKELTKATNERNISHFQG
jgi:hypothetical protein